MKKIPMVTLRPQTFRGVHVGKDVKIETTQKVAAVLTKLKRAREVPDFADFHDAIVPLPEVEAPVKRKRGRPPKAGK